MPARQDLAIYSRHSDMSTRPTGTKPGLCRHLEGGGGDCFVIVKFFESLLSLLVISHCPRWGNKQKRKERNKQKTPRKTYTRARTHAPTHKRTHARTHAHTHTHTHTHTEEGRKKERETKIRFSFHRHH